MEVQADGRRRRRERNRAAVVDALLDLLREGDPQPGAQAIAERAGISVRSVFRHFEDLDSLLAYAVERQIEWVAALYEAPPPRGDAAERTAALVRQRRQLYEEISPVRRAAIRLAPFHSVLSSQLEESHRVLRNQVARLFSPELEALRAPQRRCLLDALDSATSWPTWEGLRSDLGLSALRAASVMQGTVGAVLASFLLPSDSRRN